MHKPTLSARAPIFAALLALSTTAIAAEVSAQDRVVVVDEHHHHDRPRFRFGISGVGGGFVGQIHGGLGGVAPRIGIQLNDLVGFYLQVHGLVGAFDPYPRGATLAGFAFHEAMFELTFADMFQFGAGPSLDYIWGCSADNVDADCGGGGPFFGGDFRGAIVLGGRDPGRRTGLSISIDVHPTWVDRDFATVFLFGVGIEVF